MMGAISEMINKKQTITGEYYPSLIFNYLYKKEIIEAFEMFDLDKSGIIHISILKKILSEYDKEDILKDIEIDDILFDVEFIKVSVLILFLR